MMIIEKKKKKTSAMYMRVWSLYYYQQLIFIRQLNWPLNLFIYTDLCVFYPEKDWISTRVIIIVSSTSQTVHFVCFKLNFVCHFNK